ncbi:MAG: diguanylate cyclase [Deltaproteobacteria bacterium]|nr:diguanylate cyclase [Deltaproteobacteria bacterium]
MKLKISQKLLLGYLGMAFLTIISSLYAVINLRHLNDYTHRIIRGNVVVVEESKALMNDLLDREKAFTKFVIFQDATFANVFWEKSVEIDESLNEIRTKSVGDTKAIERLIALNKDYQSFFAKIHNESLAGVPPDVRGEQQSRQSVERMARIVEKLRKASQEDMEKQMSAINKTTKLTLRVTMLISLGSLFVGIGLAIFLAYNISRPLKRLENAAVRVGLGDFDHKLDIESHDEFASLAQTFSRMMEKLKVLEAISLDASPLTGLPGNLAIEREVKKRLLLAEAFALCHIDLDHFKPFVDKYGYAWGSELIKEVAKILTDRVKDPNDRDTFIGHIGGDDFVIIATPKNADRMSQALVKELPSGLSSFYSIEDRERGYITGRDRQGKINQFPLITVTVSVVTNEDGPFADPLEMAQRAAQVKEYGKTLEGSNCVSCANFYEEKA